ncbi:ABC transporter permease [Lachnospiraceae bacterium ASD3451]|uniref:ABC transporter permease n=1 Tax=Diplocloster agilis TaxID=2850323 RepID=UPI001DE31D81|nr:ABC transporter permease [Diplocloster agilis]MBU9744171.1 ABC transporter permease [Diplocloster agilis]
MGNLLKMERYQLLHNYFYWCGIIGIFLLGFLTADTYVPEVMGPAGGAAASLSDIFNGMVYDSTFLLIIISGILSLIFGQEFSHRTIGLEVSAGHSRKAIFLSKVIAYLSAFHVMALIYPLAGCIREFSRFGMEDAGIVFYNVFKAVVYSCLLNSATFLMAILICCYLRSSVKAVAVTVIVTFVLSLYLGYGMMLKLPVDFLPIYQIRTAVSTGKLFQLTAILIAGIWASILIFLAWTKFRKCDLT